MENRIVILIISLNVIVFYLLRVFFSPVIFSEFSLISVILTISSIIFGLLGAFLISELWSKYSEIRSLHAVWSSNLQHMIFYAKNFFKKNERFKKSFQEKVEKYVIVAVTLPWNKIEQEKEYFDAIGESFDLIDPQNLKGAESLILDDMMDSYSDASVAESRLVILGKERLFLSEWFIMGTLAAIIDISILSLKTAGLFHNLLLSIFPGVIALIFWLLYSLDKMIWNWETVSIEPCEEILDTLGVKRFYLKRDLKRGIRPKEKNYRTEDDLDSQFKETILRFIK